MREILKTFPSSEGEILSINLCGMSYCDGTYRITRKNSSIHCFEYIISGKGTIVTKNGRFHPEAGDVYYLKKGEDHLYYSDDKNPWQKIWFNISGPIVDRLIELYKIDGHYLFKNCRVFRLFDEFNKNVDSPMDRQSILDSNAVILHQIIQEMAACITKAKNEFSDDALRLKEYIDTNYKNPIRVEDLAAIIYRSQSQTIRIFKKYFDMTPYEYALKRKMQVAEQLLKGTRLSVREIATELGFTNEHYFSTAFKHHMGMTPGKCRK